MEQQRGRGLGSFRTPSPQNDIESRTQGPAQARPGQNYRRHAVSQPDPDGYVWIIPSATSNPPRPRTRVIGYNLQERKVRTVFREGSPASLNATWSYEGVTPQEWERLRRVTSTGKFINRVLNSHPYGRDEFEGPN